MIDELDLEFQPCRVLDISIGGLKLFAQKHLNMGADIIVKLNDGNVLDAMVIWSRKIDEENGYYTGVKFKESPEIIEGKIKNLMT